MSEVNVLVVFYSRRGDTERLATAAGVGAIQARANIRLRRLKDLAAAADIARDPVWTAELERMNMDYIAPREIDAQWADVIVVASPADAQAEMTQYLESLKALGGKRVVTIRDAASALAQGKAAAEEVRKTKLNQKQT
jgi:NAD(P)H dehydrogenase (quinone)